MELRRLHVDDQTGAETCLVRYQPGILEPRQRHTCGHAVYVIKGEIYDGNTAAVLVPEGGYWYDPAGDVHGPFRFAPETMVLFRTDGPFDVFTVD